MNVVILVAIALAANSHGFLIKVPTSPSQPGILSPSGWIHLQKLILPLFDNVCDVSTDPIIVRLSQEFDADATSGVYTKPEVIVNLKSLMTSKGLLTKGTIFTEYNVDYMNELKIVYEVLLYAKDFDTFYKAAAWARQTLNCGLFVDAIYLAILNRRDTSRLSVPAPYEILPNYFFNKDVIIRASSILSGEEIILSDNVRDEGNSYILNANYTANIIGNDFESKLAYFQEDIGLNSYYFLMKLKKAPWFNTRQVMSIGYGEYLYHTMKQLTARYNLERYANKLPEIEFVTLDSLSVAPYDPMLIYSDGQEFGQRMSRIDFTEDKNVQPLTTIENNLSVTVYELIKTGYNKSQIISHLMEILVTNEQSYDSMARNLLGKDSSEMKPSVLDHYLTSARDPAFWVINNNIVSLVNKALENVPSYDRNELYFPGIEILNIDVKKMTTSFDSHIVDVTDALQSAKIDSTYRVEIEQPRLNHKPFVIKLNISSLVTQKGLVKLYLGPKVAPGEFSDKKGRFMLLDSFEYTFKMGINVVSRSSEAMRTSGDFDALKVLRKKVEDAEFGLDVAPFETLEHQTLFPSRLLLPKGTPEGLPLQIFAFVAPFSKATVNNMFSLANNEFNAAVLSPGYPLDLIQDTNLLLLPNAMVKDVLITHKGEKSFNFEDGGVDKKWKTGSEGSYDPASRAGMADKKPFDYTLKKGKFEKKDDYTTKREDVTTMMPMNEDNAKENTIVDKYRLLPEFNTKENNVKSFDMDVDEIESKELKDQNIYQKPTVLLMKKKPTVYDYLLPTFTYDDYSDTDEKVYE